VSKYLIVNADDFGVTASVNDAVARCFARGRISSASLIVNAPAAAEALTFARQHGEAAIGVHFNLTHFDAVAGPSMVAPSGRFGGFSALAQAQVTSPTRFRAACRAECEAQFDRFSEGAGRMPSHLDTHLWVQLFPGVFDAMMEVAQARGIGAVRMLDTVGQPRALSSARALARQAGCSPMQLAYQTAKVVLMQSSARWFGHRRRLQSSGLFGPAIHAGVTEGLMYGDVPTRLKVLDAIVGALPSRTVAELVVHPGGDGRVDDMHYDPRHCAIERDALLSDDWPAILARHATTLVSGFRAPAEA
jgi:predicted glycoside hydrolase/deacetylase ChbG (UPF0249 family)